MKVKKKVVDKLKQSIAGIEGTSIQVVGSNLGNPSDTVEEGEAKEEGEGDAEDGEEEAGKVEDVKVEIGDNKTEAGKDVKEIEKSVIVTPSTGTDIAVTTTQVLPTNTELPVTNFIKYISVNGIDQGNIPDNIWKIIVMNESVSDKWKDIINKWVSKYTKDAENKKRWAEEKKTNGGKPISEEVNFDNKEKQKRDYWDNVWNESPVSYGYGKYSIKPYAQFQEIMLIGEIPNRWFGEINQKKLKKERENGEMVFKLYDHHKNFLYLAAKKYYKEKYGKEIDITNDYYSEYKSIIREFLDMDEYSNNILDKEYIYDKEESEEEIRNFNIAHRKTKRTRFYLNKKLMNFYKNYIDVFNNFSNTNESVIKENVNLFLLPSENDQEIWKFEQLDRFLAKMYDIRNTNMKSSNEKNKERNIIVFPEYDKITYNKYINFFNTHYNDLKEGTNLIFKGKSYKLKTAEELAEIMKGTP